MAKNLEAKGPQLMHFETYVGKAGEHRWRLKAKNGEIITSGEGLIPSSRVSGAQGHCSDAMIQLDDLDPGYRN